MKARVLAKERHENMKGWRLIAFFISLVSVVFAGDTINPHPAIIDTLVVGFAEGSRNVYTDIKMGYNISAVLSKASSIAVDVYVAADVSELASNRIDFVLSTNVFRFEPGITTSTIPFTILAPKPYTNHFCCVYLSITNATKGVGFSVTNREVQITSMERIQLGIE